MKLGRFPGTLMVVKGEAVILLAISIIMNAMILWGLTKHDWYQLAAGLTLIPIGIGIWALVIAWRYGAQLTKPTAICLIIAFVLALVDFCAELATFYPLPNSFESE